MSRVVVPLRGGRRPRVAFVLGSGGVKSLAALGVAEVLHDAGIEPDLVVGCSAGAMVGALLACDLKPADAMALAQRLWSREVTGRRRRRAWLDLARSALPARDTGFGERFALRDDRLIGERLHAAFGDRRIEELPRTLRIRATDAASGAPVLLERGMLREALRASIALPFLFAPGRVDGVPMVDGSISDPLPLSAALDADTVVAVGFPVPLPRAVSGPSRLATRITASLTNNLMHAGIAAHAGARTVLLMPTLERRVGLFETEAIPALIEAGRTTARAALPRLLALTDAQPPAQRATG